MELRGWDDHPRDFQTDFNFHKGPKWLLVLALTPYFERFAYPSAIKRGLAGLWPRVEESKLGQDFKTEGWIVHEKPKNDFERWIEGSFARLSQRKNNRLGQFLFKNGTIPIGKGHAFFWSVLPQITFTRYGAQLKRRHRIHRHNGTYKDYKKALHGERFDFSE